MKGITKSCPSCKKILIRFVNFKGEGSFQLRCPHCQETHTVFLGQKMELTIAKLAIFVIIIVTVLFYNVHKTTIVDENPDQIMIR